MGRVRRMNPPELASEPAPCYTRRGRIERPMYANVTIVYKLIKVYTK